MTDEENRIMNAIFKLEKDLNAQLFINEEGDMTIMNADDKCFNLGDLMLKDEEER